VYFGAKAKGEARCTTTRVLGLGSLASEASDSAAGFATANGLINPIFDYRLRTANAYSVLYAL
jgi:hypothetical protein